MVATTTTEMIRLLQAQSSRDSQVAVGPSDLSTFCNRCLARKLIHIPEKSSDYWLGARVGTAIHLDLSMTSRKHWEATAEEKLCIGYIPGYGAVHGTSDCFRPTNAEVIDWKTTTRDKLRVLKKARSTLEDPSELSSLAQARWTLRTYVNQLLLYGLGWSKRGVWVETITLGFICRDGKTSDDIWSCSWDFNLDAAQAVLQRAIDLFGELQEGKMPDDYESHHSCYTCSRGLG